MKRPTFVRIPSIIAALLAPLFLSCGDVYGAESIILPPRLLESSEDAPAFIAVKTRQGLERLKIWMKPDAEVFPVYENGVLSDRDWPRAVLFQGVARERGRAKELGRVRPVRGDIVGGKLRLFFSGRRTPRSFVAATRDLTSRTTARVSSVSPLKKFGCGERHPSTGASVEPVSAGETGGPSISAATVSLFAPPRQLDIGLDADYEFYSTYGANSVAEMQAILNAAEAFYTAQIGVSFRTASVNIFSSSSQPSASHNAETLLESYSLAVNISNRFGTADIFHLFSGKSDLFLDGGGGEQFPVVGLAYSAPPLPTGGPGPVCLSPNSSYGLSQRIADSVQAIVTAHEIGHNLGARHPDQDLPGQSLPQTIMSSSVGPAGNYFSEYSRGQIVSDVTQFGSCIAAESKYLTFTAKVTGTKFEAAFAPAAGMGSSCKSSIYASTKKSDLQKKLTAGTRLNLTRVRKTATKVLRGTLNSGGRLKRIYLRAVTYCTAGGIKNYQGSPIVSVRSKDPNAIASLAGKIR